MSLSPGEITSSDLSPNAGILGTQLADNTIQLRNLTDDTFRIVMSGSIAIPDVSGFTAAAGKFNSSSATTTVAHNLGYVPVALGASSVTGGGLLPFTFYGPIGVSSGSIFWDYFNINSDATNIYLTHSYIGFGGTGGVTFADSTGWNSVKYYLLQEKATIT